jgi:hypothetical protein
MVRKQHIYTTLLTVFILSLIGYFEILGPSKYWWSTCIGLLLALGATYSITNSKVSINIEDNKITVYHSGMVQGTFSKDSITQVTQSGRDGLSRIIITTANERKIYIPSGCFSDSDLEAVMNQLRS